MRRSLLEGAYIGMKVLRDVVRFKNPMRKIRHYHKGTRGMRWKTDIIDWLGGYPYESASLDEIRSFVERLGFRLEYSYKTKPEIGVFGSGCAEYRFLRMKGGLGKVE
jgi:2-polyprenyl-6-hydroxyphenyl methylase/3-demethylubiquinone-9 3-methyltransferase